MKCKVCGANIPDGAYFCAECGALTKSNTSVDESDNQNQTETADSFGVSCPSCGKIVGSSDEYCSDCGAAIKGKENILYESPQNRNNGVLIAVIVALTVVVLAACALITFMFVSGNFFVASHDNNNGTMTQNTDDSSVTNTPVATATPVPTVRPHTYEVVIAHICWDDAKIVTERMGGHLVTIQNQEEFDKIVNLLADSRYTSVKNVWIGACAPSGLTSRSSASAYWNSSEAKWITGEPFTFAQWRSGEPSGYDAQLGSEERYLQIFKPKADGGVWSYNDAGNDLSEYKANTLAYIVEFE